MFSTADVEALVLMGVAESGVVPAEFRNQRATWDRLMCGDDPWRQLARTLSESDLRNLIKGLVLLVREPLNGAGSVSPVIPLFECYRTRFESEERALGTWIVANRVNPAEPFGSGKFPAARTLSEYQAARVSHGAEMDRLQGEAQEEARERRAQKATLGLADAVRRGDLRAVAALLAKGADPSEAAVIAGVSMTELATAEGRSEVLAFLVSQGIS